MHFVMAMVVIASDSFLGQVHFNFGTYLLAGETFLGDLSDHTSKLGPFPGAERAYLGCDLSGE